MRGRERERVNDGVGGCGFKRGDARSRERIKKKQVAISYRKILTTKKRFCQQKYTEAMESSAFLQQWERKRETEARQRDDRGTTPETLLLSAYMILFII